MSNSKLVTSTLLSPNHSGKRTMSIDRITPHCVVGQLSASGICGCFASSSAQASCNYGVGTNGDIGLCVDEGNRSWCTSSNANDQRAVTIECASDKTHPYAFTDKCYQSLIKLCVDICQRNGKKKLLWIEDKNKALNYSLKSDEMLLTVHRWFANKECPGDWMYSRMGDLANKVTTQLSGGDVDSSSNITSTTQSYYRIRKSWADTDSQLGAYEKLENAKKNCPEGYSVFDKNGKVVYKNEVKEIISSDKTDKIWLGWTKRESGSVGFKYVNGDRGRAFGKYQFDYRYALVPFMKFCMDYSSHYLGFKTYASYGVGNSKLINNSSLASLWTSYCNKYPQEFEMLQDTYAYQYYYLESKKYIKNLYGINMDNHSPAVKGTLYSMAIRSGTLTGAKKFDGCNDKTSDSEMLRISYSKYGNADANRWTKAGQYGDAINALKNNEYTVISTELKTQTTETNQKEEEQTISPTYRVGTAWKDGKCVNQAGAYSILDNAKKQAKAKAASTKKTYYVFDDDGKKIYTTKYTNTSTDFESYDVRVLIPNLRIRKTPGGEILKKNGKEVYTGIGVFGITEEKKSGQYTYGKLKSGLGWIALADEYVEKIK